VPSAANQAGRSPSWIWAFASITEAYGKCGRIIIGCGKVLLSRADRALYQGRQPGPVLLGIVGIVALFFLFIRERTWKRFRRSGDWSARVR
jgi:hypothetical protein